MPAGIPEGNERMRFTSRTTADGVSEQLFTHDGIPGVIWSPAQAADPCPLILLGHGGGQHKPAPGLLSRGSQFVTGGFAVAAIDALFGALASQEKTLHANAGGHGDVPLFEVDSSARFFTRHLVHIHNDL